jgi:hypothetical protein
MFFPFLPEAADSDHVGYQLMSPRVDALRC